MAAGCSVDGDHGAGQVQLGHQRGELARAMLGRGAGAILQQNAVVVVAARSRAVPSGQRNWSSARLPLLQWVPIASR